MRLARFSAPLVCLLLGLAWPVALAQEEKPAKPGEPPAAAKPAQPAPRPPLCPVTGKPIDRQYMAHSGERPVFFASKEALDKFEAEPRKFSAAVEAQWEALKSPRIQVLCPVTGKPVDLSVAHELTKPSDPTRQWILFASNEARQQYLKDPKAYEKKLADCHSFQTNCVMCGHEIDGSVSAEIDGRRVYFGCQGCIDGFKDDKADSFTKLDEQIKKNKEAWAKLSPAR